MLFSEDAAGPAVSECHGAQPWGPTMSGHLMRDLQAQHSVEQSTPTRHVLVEDGKRCARGVPRTGSGRGAHAR
jgi:hypothetical protein